MADERTFIHRIDGDDVIEFVNQEWIEFAAENWDADAARRVPGTPIWDYVANRSVRHLLQVVVERLRGSGRTVTLPYRCDSPECRRFMEMELEVVAFDKVEFRSRILREEPREPVPLLDPEAARSPEMLVMCSWCKRVDVPPWMEVEQAVEALNLFGPEEVPTITHGICDECRDQVLSAI